VLRAIRDRADLERLARMESQVWADSEGWRVDSLARELDADPEALVVLVAEAGGEVVSAGWVRFPERTEFATLWGGATLPAWRGRGIYRALVQRRAELAVERGRRHLQVDAGPESRPILERLGFLAVTQTRPYVWSPTPREGRGTAGRS
jgi:ribosomal protein S18 acetylase RimI-like enzyme